MNDTVKKTIRLAIFGGIGGACVSVFFLIMSWGSLIEELSTGALIGHVLIQLLLGAVFGAINCASSIVYDLDRFSIAGATLMHFFFVITMFYIFGFGVWHFEFGETGFYIMTALFIIIYFIIWLVMYLKSKREVRKMNDELRKMKEMEAKENKE